MLQVRALGQKHCGGLFLLADELIKFSRLHSQIALSVSEMLPINMAMLFSEEAKRLASTTATPDPGGPQKLAPSYQALMTSPWKVSTLFELSDADFL